MTEEELASLSVGAARTEQLARPWARVTKYVAVRGISLALMFFLGMYIAVMVANLGGLIDGIYEARILESLLGLAPQMRGASPEEVQAAYVETKAAMERAYGLDQPFLLRCVRWTWSAITLDLFTPDIVERLPNTLLLVGTSYVLLFLLATFLALYLSRRYGTSVDRLFAGLSLLSAAPSWVHGVILVAVFAIGLRMLPFSGMHSLTPSNTPFESVLDVIKHAVLPVTAILLSTVFQCVYAWRSFFMIHSSEDYVELAKAKGLPDSAIERRYILRPALPYFVTSFVLLVVSFWQESIALEYLFYWPGIGKLYIEKIRMYYYSPETVIGIMVVFAYLLVLTVFVLDVVYVLVDPRVRIDGGLSQARRASRAGRRSLLPWRAASVPAGILPSKAPQQPRGKVPKTRLPRPRRRSPDNPATWREILRYPSTIAGLAIIASLVGVAIYALVTMPYEQVVKKWRTGSQSFLPAGAQPAWTNWFRRDPWPETLILGSRDGTAQKETRPLTAEMSAITISLAFDYPYRAFPQEVLLNLTSRYKEKMPFVSSEWLTPDGRTIDLGTASVPSAYTYYASQDDRLRRRLNGVDPNEALFADPARSQAALPGRYTLRIKAFVFEPDADLDAQMVVYGQVYGLAGTDMHRRDLAVGLLWGTPIALGLGLLGAVTSTLLAITLAAIGVWFGGWVDRVIQWVAEVQMLLPIFPLAIMVYILYYKSILVTLSVMIVVGSLGRTLKNFRAALLPVREDPYIEAAQSYGASNRRIILRYLVPRVIPALVPQVVIMIPGFVFLEATLSLLGVSDLYIPTWGKIIYDAITSPLLSTHYYWLLEPIALLMLTGLAFAILGYSLDRVFNPRLRSMQGGR